jgi:Tfp pilus assembly PilM family ATPase
MSTKIIALDIGTNVVRAFEMQANFRSSQPLAYYEEVIQLQEEQSLLDAQVEALGKLIENNQLKADTLCCSVPRQMVASLSIALPFIQKKQIEMTIGTQIDDLLPIDVEDIFYDYQIISQTAKNQSPAESKILIAYVKRDEFEEFLKLLQNRHIDPKLMTLGIFAYQTLLNPKFKNAQVVLNFGKSGAEWAIFDEGKLQQF